MENTKNLGLKKWEGGDRILHSEFNDNWDKIDAAMLGKKLLLDYTTEEEALTVEVPLTGVDWGSCAVAVIKIIPSEAQASPDGLWVYFGSSSYQANQGKCRSIVMGTTYDYFAEASLSGENLIFLFVGHNPNQNISGLTFYGYDVYACSFGYSFSKQTVLKIYNRGSGKTAAGTKIQIWGLLA